MGAFGIWWLEDTTKHPTLHRTAPHSKEFSCSNVSTVHTENYNNDPLSFLILVPLFTSLAYPGLPALPPMKIIKWNDNTFPDPLPVRFLAANHWIHSTQFKRKKNLFKPIKQLTEFPGASESQSWGRGTWHKAQTTGQQTPHRLEGACADVLTKRLRPASPCFLPLLSSELDCMDMGPVGRD